MAVILPIRDVSLNGIEVLAPQRYKRGIECKYRSEGYLGVITSRTSR